MIKVTEEYEVIGNKKIFGVPPGERFRKDLPPEQRQRLINRGAIKPCDQEVTEVAPAEVGADEGEETVPTDINPGQKPILSGLFKTNKEG